MQDFFYMFIRLTENDYPTVLTDLGVFNLTLGYSCENFWTVDIDDEAVEFFVFSDTISEGFFSETSILAFYTGVAYVVGSYFRSYLMYKGDRVFIVESPITDAMRNLIDAVYLMRAEKNIKKEQEYYHIVMEVLRSPELLKHLCGSSLREPL